MIKTGELVNKTYLDCFLRNNLNKKPSLNRNQVFNN